MLLKRYIMLWLTLCLLLPRVSFSAENDDISLLLDRSSHTLYVKKGSWTVKSFRVALGVGGRGGKQKRGDGKTPSGTYKITQIRDSSRFHLFIQLNYPNVDDAKTGLLNKLITREEYRSVLGAHIFNEQPPQNLPLGGAIGIHGIGVETKEKLKIHQNIDWTEGCIALRNHEVDELRNYVSVGTEIQIFD